MYHHSRSTAHHLAERRPTLLASALTLGGMRLHVRLRAGNCGGLYALVGVSVFMSIMFPTIFVLGLNGLGDDQRKLGASLLVMAIIGGALLPPLMGGVSDLAGIHWSIIVPAACFVLIFAFALRAPRTLE